MTELAFSAGPGLPLLSLTILLLLAAALAAAFLRDPRAAAQVGIGGAVGALALCLAALAAFRGDHSGLQLVERLDWLPSLGVSYALGVDGISILFLPLTALLFLAVLLAAPEAGPRARWITVNVLVLEATTIGAYAAADAVLFFCFFEAALVPGYFLIKLAGRGPAPAAAALRYMVVMLLGSLPILAGFLLAGLASAGARGGALSFDIAQLTAQALPPGTEVAVFALLLFGFAVKAPALPLHVWMPQSVAVAPVGLMAYLLGLKLGSYGFLRFVIPMAPVASADYAPWVIGVEVLAIVYAGLIALTRRDLRSVLVFSSIGHVGLITAAAFSGSADGWQGSILLMVNAGLATAGLALCIGMIERRLGTSDIGAMGGALKAAPRLGAVVFVAGLALIGVPGTSGFAGELMALRGVFGMGTVFGLIAVSGVVLSAAYFLTAYRRAFLGAPVPAVAGMRDLDRRERALGGGLIVLVLALGLLPGRMADFSSATVTAQIARAEARVAAARAPADAVRVAAMRPPAAVPVR